MQRHAFFFFGGGGIIGCVSGFAAVHYIMGQSRRCARLRAVQRVSSVENALCLNFSKIFKSVINRGLTNKKKLSFFARSLPTERSTQILTTNAGLNKRSRPVPPAN